MRKEFSRVNLSEDDKSSRRLLLVIKLAKVMIKLSAASVDCRVTGYIFFAGKSAVVSAENGVTVNCLHQRKNKAGLTLKAGALAFSDCQLRAILDFSGSFSRNSMHDFFA